MATVHGGWSSGNGGFRSVLVYSVTETNTSVTINTTLKIEIGSSSFTGFSFTGTTTIGTGSGSSTSQTFRKDFNKQQTYTLFSKSRTYTKGATVQSVALSGRVSIGTSSTGSTASATVTIPKRSYPVTYDANGGDTSSIPAAQVKYQGETLKLSTTIPRRPGCTFLGWATAADGTGTAYAAGGSYTANAALKLYAIWLGVSVPTIATQRTDSEGAEADEGTYGTLSASWQVIGSPAADVTVVATNVNTGASIALDGDATGSKAAQQALTGNVSALFGADGGQSGALDTDTRYIIRVTVTATALNAYSGSTVRATATSYITYARITMDFRVGGRGVSFGKTAVRDGFDVAMTPIYLAEPPKHDTDRTVTSIPSVIEANTSNATITGVATRTWGKVLMLTVNWTNANEIAVSATGNIADLSIGTLAEGMRPVMACGGMSHGNNAGQELYYVAATGAVTLCSMEGTGESRTVASGTAHNMHAIFILP